LKSFIKLYIDKHTKLFKPVHNVRSIQLFHTSYKYHQYTDEEGKIIISNGDIKLPETLAPVTRVYVGP